MRCIAKWRTTIGYLRPLLGWGCGPHIGGVVAGGRVIVIRKRTTRGFRRKAKSFWETVCLGTHRLKPLLVLLPPEMSAFRASPRCLAARIPSTLLRGGRSFNASSTRSFAAVGTEQPVWTESQSSSVAPQIDAVTKKAEPRAAPGVNEVLRKAVAATEPRNDWTREEISSIYHEPLMELVHQAVSRLKQPF